MEHSLSLKGKNIVVTGASSGIGQQCAITCSEAGANVILIARNQSRLKETINKLNNKGNHLSYTIDLTEFSKLENIIDDVVSKLGKISGYIHAAGIEQIIPLKLMRPEKYTEIFNINVISGFELARIISKKKNVDLNCNFVFISSVTGVVGNPALVSYSASKGAIISGVKSMALELAAKGITVNSISPGIVENTFISNNMWKQLPEESKQLEIEKHPLGLGNTKDVASASLFLLSNESRWITGINLVVDGGYTAK